MTTIQRRAYPRINCEVPIVISRADLQPGHGALLKNYSDGGIYFETSLSLKEGDTIKVKADDESVLDPVTSGTWKVRRAEVRWCRSLTDDLPVLYGCGVAYLTEE